MRHQAQAGRNGKELTPGPTFAEIDRGAFESYVCGRTSVLTTATREPKLDDVSVIRATQKR
ncbi:hypothetical protein HPB50_025763 [Hyalomma asiaticum]|uniref:Uncharacterized protein n=1 Tax=Hyalomma asiaticum TaxID=266040 RepID=A0ACB7RQT6_HYAAI|nr:hypothetical protein HPB50_025763 [Hyalomma asiaticum]